MRAVVVCAALAAGCFTPDLGDGQVACGTGGACPPGYVCRTSDQRCWRSDGQTGDLGSGGGGGSGGGDMASSGCGSDGTRVCADASHSAVCMGGTAHVDRACPPGSTCMSGHCAPPANAATCTSSKSCGGGAVCDEYDVGGTLRGYCTQPLPGAGGGVSSQCNASGYDPTCKTGVCASDGNNQFCLYPCSGQNDCMGSNCNAVMAPLTVDGAPTSGLKTCG